MIIIDTPALLLWLLAVVLSWIVAYKTGVSIERYLNERHQAKVAKPGYLAAADIILLDKQALIKRRTQLEIRKVALEARRDLARDRKKKHSHFIPQIDAVASEIKALNAAQEEAA